MKPLEQPTTNFGWKIDVDNVNEALPLGLQLCKTAGVATSSRGKNVIRVPGPVSTVYRNPMRRVLFDEVRDANPFFHMIDALWLLSGSERIDLPTRFLKRYGDFSDDSRTAHGAYGYRLRHWGTRFSTTADAMGLDQLKRAVDMLRDKPDTRQCVLSIWDPVLDLGAVTKDMPCNDMIMLDIVDGRLNMTVNNRSNDVVWGAYGANAVQFSMLHEWLSVMVGCEVGYYVQQSNNFHVYEDNPFWSAYCLGNTESGHVYNHYMKSEVQPWPIAMNPAEAVEVMRDCEWLACRAEHQTDNGVEGSLSGGFNSPFFQSVVSPMLSAYRLFQAKSYTEALMVLNTCQAADWRVACQEWVLRRKEKHDATQAVFHRAAAATKKV